MYHNIAKSWVQFKEPFFSMYKNWNTLLNVNCEILIKIYLFVLNNSGKETKSHDIYTVTHFNL